MNNQENIKTDFDGITLRDWLYKLRNLWIYLCTKWLLLFTACILGGILGFTYALFEKPIYKAELSFALEDEKSSGGGIGAALGLASQFGIDLGGSGGGAFSGDNLLMLMKSRSMVESALLSPVYVNKKQQTLLELYISYNNLRKGWKNNVQLKNIQFLLRTERSKFTIQQDSVMGSIYNKIVSSNLSVDKFDKKLTIITVAVKSENELFSKQFTEALVKTVSNFYIETKTKKSTQNVLILQRQTDSVRRELNGAINGVATSVDVNPNANPTLQILRVPSQRHQVDVQANQAILTELVKNLEISKVSLRRETPLIQIIDKPILPLEKNRLGIVKGIILGGFLFGFLFTLYLVISKAIKDVMI
ncbi:lipopolysaccharide biosynthesis protein [Mucilaginibacter sp.]|jgi:hypothetical protein|uniref:lipopolysaccharide biosynthesis protein n=1 Tax=Mucilaginibacter sp. TaxID=1882438 RepID=UPI0035661584